MVTIRLSRQGSKRNPFYQITVAERTASRDGRFVERLGFYNPVARGGEEKLRLNVERADYWISQGARPSERVKKLIGQARSGAVPTAAMPAAAEASAEASADAE
jgi:small subunit ribosomal protein S16